MDHFLGLPSKFECTIKGAVCNLFGSIYGVRWCQTSFSTVCEQLQWPCRDKLLPLNKPSKADVEFTLMI